MPLLVWRWLGLFKSPSHRDQIGGMWAIMFVAIYRLSRQSLRLSSSY